MSDIYTPGSVVPFGSVELSPSVSPRRTAAMSAAPAASGLRGLQVDTSAEHDVLSRCGFDDGPAPRHHSARSSASKHSATSPMLGSSLLSPSLGTVSPLSTVQLDVSDSDEENGDVVGVPASHGRLEGGIRVPGAHRKSSADVGLGHSARSRPSIRSRRLRKGISDDRRAASSPAASPIRSNGHATGSPRDRAPRRAKSRPSSPIHAPEGAAVPEAQAVTVSKLAAQQTPPATTMEPVRSPIEHDKTAAHGKQGGPPVSPIAGEGNTDKPRGHPQGKKRDVNYDDDDDDFVGELRHDSHPDLGGGARTSRGHRRSSSGSALSSSGDDSSSSSSDSGSSSDDDQQDSKRERRRGSGGASGSVGPGPVAGTGRGTRPDSGRGRRRAGAARPLGSLEHNDERKGNGVSPPRTPPRTSRRRSSSGTRGDHETPRDEARSPSEAAESRQADRVKALYERLRALGTKYHALIETMTSSHMYRLPWSVVRSDIVGVAACNARSSLGRVVIAGSPVEELDGRCDQCAQASGCDDAVFA